jgi:drug/metabolite transporter (DMT)-like permease
MSETLLIAAARRAGHNPPEPPENITTMKHANPLLLTALAMLAFAANSVLCRAALGEPSIDAASFTSLRLVSGALMLWLLLRWQSPQKRIAQSGNWASGFYLFLYAAAFSFAYLQLDAGIGALILFGMVQMTMISAALLRGERPSALEWAGLIAALLGLVYLMSPGLSAPPLFGALLMAIAGIAWGLYSLRGRGVADPLAATAGNFLRAAPMGVAVSLLMLGDLSLSPSGAALAITSGAITSGVGYAIWYSALPHLRGTTAASVQLSVPVIAALGGVAFMGELLSLRLVLASALILGGVGLVLYARERQTRPG